VSLRKALFTLTSLVCSLALAATVYKWVDENGIVHTRPAAPERAKVGAAAGAAHTRRADYTRCARRTDRHRPRRRATTVPGLRSRSQPTTRPSPASTRQHQSCAPIPAATARDQIFLILDGQPLTAGGLREPVHLTPGIRGSHTHAGGGAHNDCGVQVPDPGRDLQRAAAFASEPGQPPASLSPRTRGGQGARCGWCAPWR